MHGFSAKVPRRVPSTDEWHDDFRKKGDLDLILQQSRITEGWIFLLFYVSIWTGPTGHNVGRHDGTPHDRAPLVSNLQTITNEYMLCYMLLPLLQVCEV